MYLSEIIQIYDGGKIFKVTTQVYGKPLAKGPTTRSMARRIQED